MRAKSFFCLVTTVLLGTAPLADAQQSTNVPRIAYVTATSAAMQARRFEIFRRGLRELGYVEGKNILVEYRFADGKVDRLPQLAAELVDLKVNVIVTAGPSVTGPVKRATSTIPIVIAGSRPRGQWLCCQSRASRREHHWLVLLSAELNGKRLELLKEIVPKLTRVAVLATSSNPGNSQSLKDTESAADQFGVKVQYLEIRYPNDIEAALQTAK